MVKIHTGSEYFRNRTILILKYKSANPQKRGPNGRKSRTDGNSPDGKGEIEYEIW